MRRVKITVLVVGLSILSLFRIFRWPLRSTPLSWDEGTPLSWEEITPLSWDEAGAAIRRQSAANPKQWVYGYNPRKSKGIELGLQNQEVMPGDSATFRLRVRYDTEEAGEWNKDDVTLTHCGKTQISVSGRDRYLTVTNVHPADTGIYECRVGEEITSAKLSINQAHCIQAPPPPIVRI